MVMAPALLVLLLPLLAASLPVQDAAELTTSTTTMEHPANDQDGAVQADEAAAEDDDEMRDRMAYLILSLWGRDLQGLEGLDGPDGGPYLAVEEEEGEDHERQKREIVFRPLWESRMRHAAKQRAAQRYWTEYRRYQRVGRYGRSATDADEEASLARRQRTPRAAPLSEAALTAADGQMPLSRVRRQWTFQPLFTSRMRQARDRRRRLRRDVGNLEVTDEGTVLPRSRRQSAHRPLLAFRQRAARLGRQRRETASARTRREWTDVPLFAVKQIEAERAKEEREITHREHHHYHEPEQEQEQEHRIRDYARDYRNYWEYTHTPYNPYYGYRPYRDYQVNG